MALTSTLLVRDLSCIVGAVVGGASQIDSYTTTSGSLVFVQITTTAAAVTEAQHFTSISGPSSSLTFLGCKQLSGGTTKCVEWYYAAGAGSTGTSNVTYSGSGFTTISSQEAFVWEVTGGTGLTILQSAFAKATNATGTVTLGSSVQSGNECVYMAAFDSNDTATPGSGWTEITDQNINSLHGYYQRHPTPSGSQNGACTITSSIGNASAIVEINNPATVSTGGGWGFIPIK